jgi:hypothetical protein
MQRTKDNDTMQSITDDQLTAIKEDISSQILASSTGNAQPVYPSLDQELRLALETILPANKKPYIDILCHIALSNTPLFDAASDESAIARFQNHYTEWTEGESAPENTDLIKQLIDLRLHTLITLSQHYTPTHPQYEICDKTDRQRLIDAINHSSSHHSKPQ